MIFVCGEHIERALEDFTIEKEAAPDLLSLDQLASENQLKAQETTCQYCSETAGYVVKDYAD